MEVYSYSEFTKNELARIFLYKVYGKLDKYGITKVVINSSLLSLNIMEYKRIAQLRDAVLNLDLDTFDISTGYGVYTIDIASIRFFSIKEDYISIKTAKKEYIFRKD